MVADPFVPDDFNPPRELVTPQFRLEPLGPEHNERDHTAWMSSIEHIRSTPGFPDGDWPPLEGMTLERNLADLQRHADDFERRVGFTYTVLDDTDDVIGCVYIYPDPTGASDAEVQSWVRADRADLDMVLYDAVSEWLATHWPFGTVRYAPRRPQAG
ncbi:MAG TPA: N-acetyltransferase [Acidimicrobiia bacterium]